MPTVGAVHLRRTLGLQRIPGNLKTSLGLAMAKVSVLMKSEGTLALTGAKLKRKGLFLENPDPDRLAVRTGSLRKTLVSASFQAGNKYVATFGTTAQQVPLLELGGRVTAKGKMLTIPTVNVLTSTGRYKDRWATIMARGGLGALTPKERKDLGLFVLKAKRRGTEGGWIAQRTWQKGQSHAPKRGRKGQMKSTGRVTVLFLLRRTVNIAARHMLSKALRKRILPKATLIVGRELAGGLVVR